MNSSNDKSDIKKIIKSGAIWVSLISFIGPPIALYRNYILGYFDNQGLVLGSYAIVLLFYNSIITFGIFGGTSVLTNFIPKIEGKKEQSNFIFSYIFLSFILTLIFISVCLFFPKLIYSLFKNNININEFYDLLILIPFIILAQIGIYILQGLMKYKLAVILTQAQSFLISIICTLFIIYYKNIFEDFGIINGFKYLLIFINLVIILIAWQEILKNVQIQKLKFNLPKNFWKFSGFIHLNTFTSFAYQSIDQLFILSYLTLRELGGYFIIIQLGEVIRFLSIRIGQVLLSSFSKLIHTKSYTLLNSYYKRATRLLIIISTALSLFIIIFANVIMYYYNENYSSYFIYLSIIAVLYNIASLGPINSMLVLSFDLTDKFLLINLSQITIQFFLTYLLIDINYGIMGVIIGRFSGLLFAQIGLFLLVYTLRDKVRFNIPKEYFISQLLVIIVYLIIYQILTNNFTLLIQSIFFILAYSFFLIFIRFNSTDLKSLKH